jgi:hypothetical protein
VMVQNSAAEGEVKAEASEEETKIPMHLWEYPKKAYTSCKSCRLPFCGMFHNPLVISQLPCTAAGFRLPL